MVVQVCIYIYTDLLVADGHSQSDQFVLHFARTENLLQDLAASSCIPCHTMHVE